MKITPFHRCDKKYEVGIVWIAEFDEAAETDPEVVTCLPSVILMSEMFNLQSAQVADDVLKIRQFQKNAVNLTPKGNHVKETCD